MLGHAKDYIFRQISGAIAMHQESHSTGYWCSASDADKLVAKLEWMLSSAMGDSVSLVLDAPNPEQSFQIKIGEVIDTVNATFCLINCDSPFLFEVLTSKFPRIVVPKNLTGYDAIYQEWIDDMVETRRRQVLADAGFDS